VGQGFVIVEASRSPSDTTLGRSPLGKWSDWRRELQLTTQTGRQRQTFTPPAGLEPALPASEWPHTHASDASSTTLVLNYSLPVDKYVKWNCAIFIWLYFVNPLHSYMRRFWFTGASSWEISGSLPYVVEEPGSSYRWYLKMGFTKCDTICQNMYAYNPRTTLEWAYLARSVTADLDQK